MKRSYLSLITVFSALVLFSLTSCRKDDPGTDNNGGNTTPPPVVYGPSDYAGNFDNAHNCSIDLTVTTLDLVNNPVTISESGTSGINLEEMFKGLTENYDVAGVVDDREFDVNNQTFTVFEVPVVGTEITVSVEGSGMISEDKNTITLDLDYNPSLGDPGSCTCTLTRQ